MYNEIPRAHLSTSREIYVFTLCSVRFFLLVLRVLLEVLPPLQTGWEHGPLLWRQAWCWAGAMEELLLSMLPCVPWPSFLCACGCRRPKEERSRKLHFHSAEAVQCSETKHHHESLRSPHVLSRRAIWDAEPMKSAAILQPCFVWMYHLVSVHCTIWFFSRRQLCLYV